MIQHDNEHLTLLVRELSKGTPSIDIVKAKSEILGIPYSPDLIIMMSDVLVYLAKQPKKKSPMKEKIA